MIGYRSLTGMLFDVVDCLNKKVEYKRGVTGTPKPEINLKWRTGFELRDRRECRPPLRSI